MSKLFEYLYMTFISFWMLWVYSLIIIDYLKYDSVTEVRHAITKLCLNIENHSTNKQQISYLLNVIQWVFAVGIGLPRCLNQYQWQ